MLLQLHQYHGTALTLQLLCRPVLLLQLKSPAVQQEIVAAALEDPEVFAILAQRQDVVRDG
jgi:hypothetical protein